MPWQSDRLRGMSKQVGWAERPPLKPQSGKNVSPPPTPPTPPPPPMTPLPWQRATKIDTAKKRVATLSDTSLGNLWWRRPAPETAMAPYTALNQLTGRCTPAGAVVTSLSAASTSWCVEINRQDSWMVDDVIVHRQSNGLWWDGSLISIGSALLSMNKLKTTKELTKEGTGPESRLSTELEGGNGAWEDRVRWRARLVWNWANRELSSWHLRGYEAHRSSLYSFSPPLALSSLWPPPSSYSPRAALAKHFICVSTQLVCPLHSHTHTYYLYLSVHYLLLVYVTFNSYNLFTFFYC